MTLLIARDECVPRHRIHPPAGDQVFPARKRLRRAQVEMSKQRRATAKDDRCQSVYDQKRMNPVGRRVITEQESRCASHTA